MQRFRSREEALKYWQAFRYYLDKCSERMIDPEAWREIFEEAWDPALTYDEIRRRIDRLFSERVGDTPEELLEKGVPIMNEWDRLASENAMLRSLLDSLSEQADVVPRGVYEDVLRKLGDTERQLAKMKSLRDRWMREAKRLREEKERLEAEVKRLREGLPRAEFDELKRRIEELTEKVDSMHRRIQAEVEEEPIRPPMIGVSKEEAWYHVLKIPEAHLVMVAADGRPRLLVECDLVSFPENDPRPDLWLEKGWLERSSISEAERDDLIRYALQLLSREGVSKPRAYKRRLLAVIPYSAHPDEIRRRVEREVETILEVEKAMGIAAGPPAPAQLPPPLERAAYGAMPAAVLMDEKFVEWLRKRGISVRDYLAMDPLTQRDLYYRDYLRGAT